MEGFTKGRVDYLISQEKVRIKQRQRKRFAPERRACDYQAFRPPSVQVPNTNVIHRLVGWLRSRHGGAPLQ